MLAARQALAASRLGGGVTRLVPLLIFERLRIMSETTAGSLHVFVYGTLRRGGSNDIRRLAPAPRWVGDAVLAGTLYDLGAYPGLVLGGATGVRGEVYAIAPALLAVLDEIEEVYPQRSGEYLRREVQVQVAGASLACQCYVLSPARAVGRRVIASGDWMLQGCG